MPANVRDTQLAISFGKQTDLVTPVLQAKLMRLTKLNDTLASVNYATEEANEIGSGTDFVTNISKTVKDTSFPLEKVISSQFAAWAFSFGFGKVVKTGASSPFTYTITPIVPATDCLALPSFTYLEKLPHCGGAGDVVYRALIGMVISQFSLTLEKGPSRTSARMSVTCAGTGRTDDAPSLTIPASIETENRLPASSMTLAINGQTNLVSSGLIESIEFTWDNTVALEDGYYPGSGIQDGFALRGRMEIGERRRCSLVFTARAQPNAPELVKLKALSEGTAVIGLVGDLISGADYHSLELTLHRVIYSAVELPSLNGKAGVRVTVTPMFHTTNGLATCVVKTTKDAIGA